VEASAQVLTHQAALEVGLEGQFVVPLLERSALPGLVTAAAAELHAASAVAELVGH